MTSVPCVSSNLERVKTIYTTDLETMTPIEGCFMTKVMKQTNHMFAVISCMFVFLCQEVSEHETFPCPLNKKQGWTKWASTSLSPEFLCQGKALTEELIPHQNDQLKLVKAIKAVQQAHVMYRKKDDYSLFDSSILYDKSLCEMKEGLREDINFIRGLLYETVYNYTVGKKFEDVCDDFAFEFHNYSLFFLLETIDKKSDIVSCFDAFVHNE